MMTLNNHIFDFYQLQTTNNHCNVPWIFGPIYFLIYVQLADEFCFSF